LFALFGAVPIEDCKAGSVQSANTAGEVEISEAGRDYAEKVRITTCLLLALKSYHSGMRAVGFCTERSKGVFSKWIKPTRSELHCCRCLAMDGSDGRVYVALGKLLVQQRRYDEARSIYEEGSTATGARP